MRTFITCTAISIAVAMGASGAVKAHEAVEQAREEARVDAMQATTTAFIATLNDAQRDLVIAAIDDVGTRTNWSNLPVGVAPRSGIAVEEMNSGQRIAFHAMLAAAFSSQGYLTTTTIMSNEDVLHELSASIIATMSEDDPLRAQREAFIANYDAEKFYVVVFGDPQGSDWGWTVTGHHYAVNFTVSSGRIVFTPLFLGANPQVVPEGRFAGFRLLQHEADRAMALIASLDAAQLERAVIADAVDGQVFAGPGRQDRIAAPLGIPASDLGPLQHYLLEALVNEFLDHASDEASARQRLAIDEDGVESLHFAWWGPTGEPTGRYMFRIQGPSILIDYVRESSGDDAFNHVHSIVRDPSNDYGADWLAIHYDESHGE
ncbi:DUF3500 domain-containing protein [Aurantiacibacter gilvus]|uniref:DUF3500 domain-containing protein n=1 Tax=Aurantiacibacter gilvus TaxID=3139141 RepID=A0ABU9IAT0_9SPHN